MNFQGLGNIEKYEWYIDLAFRSANKAGKEVKSQKSRKDDTIKKAELAKIRAVKRTLTRHFDIILKGFPSVDTLTEFYQELIRVTLEYSELKKSLGAVRWAQQKVEFFSDTYGIKINQCQDFKRMIGYSKEYYGRISSVVKQIRKSLEYLEMSRKIMKDFPSIKSNMFTVAIAGFPNVGKTTLLSKITTSNPEIANYAFTTKKLNTGYSTINKKKVQFIDTPGTLNRFERMNPIEKQAYLAIKYCSDIIIFVFDISDETYSKDKQKKLLAALNRFKKPILIYFSKSDLVENYKEKLPGIDGIDNTADLKEKISELDS